MSRTEISFTEIDKGFRSEIKEQDSFTILTKKDWQGFWQRHSGTSAEPPKVDFRRNMVVAVFLGQKNTGGYTIKVERVEEGDDDIIVHTRTTPPQGMRIQSQTQPFCMIALKKIKGKRVLVLGLR